MSVQELDLVVGFLDVGHGDSAIVRFREDHQVKTIVVDGGGPAHSGVLLAYLLRNGITTVDLLVASHIDRQHIAGLLRVVESGQITVQNFWGPACESAQPSVAGLRVPDERAYQRLYSRIRGSLRPEAIFCPVARAPVPPLFAEAAITVLNPPVPNVLKAPPAGAPPRDAKQLLAEQNDLALVLHIESYGIRVLLGSDAQAPFWAAVASDPTLSRYLDVNILKVPNYGRASGLPPAVAGALHTEYAVFSLDAKHDREPAAEVLAPLREMGAEVLCTEHAAGSSFCANAHCHAANGGQNIVFARCRGDSSYSTSAYYCPLEAVPA